MKDIPFVSVIIPFYNTPEKAFRRCIQSLKEQTYGEFEVIVINDGSKKDCKKLLESVASSDCRIRVINKSNEGSAIARNIGISEACGEYIMFLDSDDSLVKYCLEEAVNLTKTYESDLVLGGVKRVFEDEIDEIEITKSNNPRIVVVAPSMRDSLMMHIMGVTSNAFLLQDGYIADGPVARLLRRSIASETLFSRESFWNDDTIWNTLMIKKCTSISIVDNVWYKYLIHRDSKTRRFRPDCPCEFKYRTKQEVELFKELWPNCMEGIYNRVFNDTSILYKTFLFHPENNKSRKELYQIYKSCIHVDAYRESLKGLNFNREKRIINRIAKEIVRFTAYYGPNIISYMILKTFYAMRKDTL